MVVVGKVIEEVVFEVASVGGLTHFKFDLQSSSEISSRFAIAAFWD
jgi:hypothetical protein